MGSNEKNQSYTDRITTASSTGFRSERSNYKSDPDMSTGGGSTDRSNKEKNDGSNGINFFFYKNFNKFIQNLYIQDELLLKKKFANDKKESEKFTSPNTNSYRKEPESSYAKKPSNPANLNKKPSTAIPSSRNSKGITTTLLKNESAKKFINLDEDKKYYYKPKDELYNNYVKNCGSKTSRSINKSGSKNGLNLDFSKAKYDQPEVKSFLTPREYNKY